MMDLIDRAEACADEEIQELRELEAHLSAESDEPTPRVMTDGGRPTTGWRSPVGGPRYDGPIPGDRRKQENQWRGEQIQMEIEEIERAEAVAGHEPQGSDAEVRPDGGRDEEIAERLLEAHRRLRGGRDE